MDYDLNQQKINNWYHTYSNDIYKFILYMINDNEQAKDLMQDTFIKAYIKLDSFHEENEKGWLYKIARNVTIDFIRRKKPITYLTDSALSIKSPELTPEKKLSLNEQERELYVAISKLKRSHREVIILRKIKEFSIKETAYILGWSEGKVKTNLWRGVNSLKKQLEKEGFRHESI
ncbi:RNA polymerase sigma factor [Salipaludibacillus aurantiacus]|uniref:RNA polymerase sigma-70 factor, ECF subfamily n=1 Tax=Salipaludibacillus aurantiacus TaxID=1601833 RepID=A0A1H9UT27_9BACI|nr:RNA polymerase sigma factor [Salipaludibacillus aurantiacus]SES12284.1 RNA polymerase sigma-70 factor, ECF subfamily [Salipaludibacillus aurantiacus]